MKLPALVVYATGTTPPRSTHLGIVTELALLASSQYIHYNFDAMCKFGDTYLGCNEAGIFALDGDSDNNIKIDAFFELLTTDFGIPNQKRIRKVYLGYEASGSLVLEVLDDGNNSRRYTVESSLKDQRQSNAKISVGRDGKGRYWTFKVENINGCDFSLDSIDVLMTILNKKPGKTYLSKAKLVLPALDTYRSEGSQ